MMNSTVDNRSSANAIAKRRMFLAILVVVSSCLALGGLWTAHHLVAATGDASVKVAPSTTDMSMETKALSDHILTDNLVELASAIESQSAQNINSFFSIEFNEYNHYLNAAMLAARFGKCDALQLLIAHGADVNASDNDGNSPLHWALGVHRGPPLGPDRHAVANEEDLSIDASAMCVQLLIDAGARIDLENRHGVTPLMVAAHNNVDCSIISTLIRHGADPFAKNARGFSTMSFARPLAKDCILKSVTVTCPQ